VKDGITPIVILRFLASKDITEPFNRRKNCQYTAIRSERSTGRQIYL